MSDPKGTSPSTPTKAKRSKTFTGCFTCRSRKIRCDLTKPNCKNCTRARLICSGYDIKLRWSIPIKFTSKAGNAISSLVVFENTSNQAVDDENGNGGEFFHRRNIDFVTWDAKKNCRPYETYEQMDRDLAVLHNSVMKDDRTKLEGPFGCFQGNGTKRRKVEERPKVELEEFPSHDQLWLSNELRDDALLTAAALNGDSQFLDLMTNFNNIQNTFQTDLNNTNDFLNLVFHRTNGLSNQQISTPQITAPILQELEPANENLEIHLHASKFNQPEEDTDIVEGDNSNTTTMPDSIMSIVQNPLQPRLGFDVSLQSIKFGLPTTALQVQPLTRYLLNYYITLVADLMTVIPLTENPWTTIYFPRAMLAIGELASLGQTSIAKNALLNALLAVSAFNLQSKFPKNSDPMKYYLNLGIRLRNQASLFVKKLLGSNNDYGIEQCLNTEKYKDVLCAIMSMISVDLVWGTMQDTNFYIKWCGRVIATKMANKKKLSSKARILHRIFSSLKLIQESTCLQNIKEYDDNYDILNNDKNKIDFIINDSKDTSPMFVNKKLVNRKKNDENFATDALYGLPNSLIVLFHEIVQLLRMKIYHKEINKELPPKFDKQVENLTEKLNNWKLDWNLYEIVGDDDKKFESPMHEATYHHILSFYHALTIYFNRLIREIAATEVQDKVEITLHHLNSIQKLIAKGEASMIPLFWQGFIAGCEALSLNLQMGFKKWGADIALYLGSYWGARQIMLEVWRRKRMKETRDDWVSVIQDWEMNLMLN